MTKLGSHNKLLIAILATLFALFAHKYLPQKKLTIWPMANSDTFFFAGPLADGSNSAYWLNEAEHQWRCNFPEQQNQYFPCGLNIKLGTNNNGVDFSKYRYLRLKLDYIGTAKSVQISMRNYNSEYTKPEDPNSAKFMAVTLRTQELNRELLIDLRKFTVAHWWIVQYQVPLASMHAEMDNITSFTVDFPSMESHIAGNQDLTLKEVELIGEWISRENWYLGIILLWLGTALVWMLMEFIRLKEKNSEFVAVNSALVDSNQHLKSETNRFRQLSTLDPLTQLYNRTGITNIMTMLMNLSREKKSSHKSETALSIILIDIDYFKKINDTYGHDTGDKVLTSFARILTQHLRQEDYVSRWGGEEFLIIQPWVKGNNALLTAERLCKIISSIMVDPVHSLYITASFGVSELVDGEDFTSCVKRADQALYTAKKNGRNRCVLAEK
jgi:diguanylate cyclase (GGDEF)-like protein